MVASERAQRVPRNLRVEMAMVIDEAGRDRLTLNVDHPRRGPCQLPDLGDLAVRDRHVSPERGQAGAIDDASIFTQQVVSHHRLSFQTRSRGTSSRSEATPR